VTAKTDKKKDRRRDNSSAVQAVMKTQKQAKMAPSSHSIKDLTQNTTAMATRTSPNKRSNQQNVHYNSWYISLLSSAKQQREMTKFCVVWRTWTTTANFTYFYLELNAFVAYSAGASFNTDKHTGKYKINAKFQSKIVTHFLVGVVLVVALVYA